MLEHYEMGFRVTALFNVKDANPKKNILKPTILLNK